MSTKKKIVIIFAAMLCFLNLGFAAFYFLVLSSEEDTVEPVEPKLVDQVPKAAVTDEEYYSIHFSYNDAVELCVMEAISRNSNLIQLSVNELSSRFNASSNMYLIKIDSHVGTPVLYDEKAHTCEIDPKVQGVAFYKEITKRKAVRPQG